jgi:hypothetical protein
MNMNQVAKKIAINEGLKKAVNIAQIKEILKFAAIICADDAETQAKFLVYGAKASKRLSTKGK